MNKIIILAGGILSSIIFSACLTTLQPLVTEDTIITDDRVTGTWQEGERVITIEPIHASKLFANLSLPSMVDKTEGDVRFEMNTGTNKKDSAYNVKKYIVSYRKKDIDYYMLASLTRIKGTLFMDLLPIAMKGPVRKRNKKMDFIDNGIDFNYNYLPSFTLAKVIIKENKTIMRVHKSYVIAKSKIVFFEGNYVKVGGFDIPISASYKDDRKKHLGI